MGTPQEQASERAERVSIAELAEAGIAGVIFGLLRVYGRGAS